VVQARRPELRARLAAPAQALWSEMPPAVRAPARALAVRNAPETAPMLVAGPMLDVEGRVYARAGQVQAPPASADDANTLVRAIQDWQAGLARATQRAQNLWAAANATRAAVDAATLAASEHPDGALNAAGQRLREAAEWAGGGLLILGAIGLAVFAFFGRRGR